MAKVTVKMNRNLQKAVDKAEPQTLSEAARYVWRIARASVKHRKDPDKKSSAGEPPHSHKSHKNQGFKRTIVWALENNKVVAVVGPRKVMGTMTEIARSHEFGGARSIKEFNPDLEGDEAKLGAKGPVRARNISAKKDTVLYQDPHKDPKTGETVYWIKIRTKSQARQAARIYRRLNKKYGKKIIAHYPARPFMRPALALAAPKLSRFWYNAVKP